MKEEWRKVPGFDYYEISNLGQIRRLEHYRKSCYSSVSLLTECFVTPIDNGKGYKYYRFREGGKRKTYYVHRLVYEAFVGGIPSGFEINHIDEDKSNNKLCNLELITHKANCNYGTRNARAGDKTRISVQCVETGEVYPSMIEASRKTGIKQGGISNACHKKTYTAGGYHWEIVRERKVG